MSKQVENEDFISASELESSLSSVADLQDDEALSKKLGERSEPSMTDPKWSDFVVGHFVDGETDKEGNPFVAGLRRVARLLLGPILVSKASVVQAPSIIPGSLRDLQVATVEYNITIMWCRDLENGLEAYPVEFCDVADVYVGNTDPEYARYASATAATRAEARCLRKALMLQRVVAAEEKTKVPLEDSGISGIISTTQINFIDTLCKRCSIDVMKFVRSGKIKYEYIQDIPFKEAAKMVEHLSKLQREPALVSKEIKGYKKDWRNDESAR